MKRKFVSMILMLCSLVFVLGADSISYNAGQPNPNPGGMKNTIEANGTYTLDTGHTLSSISFIADDGSISTSATADTKGGQWKLSSLNVNAGTYKCTARLYVDDGQKIWVADEAVANGVVVK